MGFSKLWRWCKPVIVTSLCAILALPLAACSINLPLASLFGRDDTPADPVTTGTLATQPSPTASTPGQGPSVFNGLSPEDIRRSKAALALALDPEGQGQAINWDNAETGQSGSFSAVSTFYLNNNQLCRRYAATIANSGAIEPVSGEACRTGPGNWDVQPAVTARQ